MKQKTEVKYIDTSRNIGNEVYEKELKESVSDFLIFMLDILTKSFKLFKRKRTKNSNSIVELFRTRHDLYSYNKKAFTYLLERGQVFKLNT